nr:unnamed protein product [Digitaria exilis]
MGRSSRACSVLGSALLLLLLSLGSAAAQKGSTWKTLSGKAPAIVAKGGFSGLFPDSSDNAYLFVASGKKTYNVNGVSVSGWFSVDYKSTDLQKVFLKQSVLSRAPAYDGALPIVPVEVVLGQYKAPAVWLNVQQDSFYSQFNLSMRNYILSTSKQFIIDYISSPEVKFLTSISGRVAKNTKLVFRFLDESSIEPSTNQTYGSMLKNLTFVKTFASGILVPKSYIWPVSPDNYLLPYTSVVDDAHKAGLEIYASDFANDFTISYNYSYDPLAEYLAFVDNGAFSVDGVLTDFPITPSEAIGCFSNLNNSKIDHAKPLVISHNGASGDYPDCTDQAYEKAVADGADVIDCPVQHAAFMAEKLGFGVVDAVIKALDDSGYSKQTAQNVMIQSTNSSVLVKFKQETKYNLVYMIEEDVRDAAPSSVADIKKFADAVSVTTTSVLPVDHHYLINQTNKLVQTLQSAGFPVYVYVLMNEFVSQPNDFFADATSQINAYVQGAKVDGVITDFPGTAHRYKLRTCVGKNEPAFMYPVQPGGLLSTIDPVAQPPAAAPMPLLTDSDVAEPPLPPVSNTTTAPSPSSHASLRIKTDVSILVTLLLFCASLLI